MRRTNWVAGALFLLVPIGSIAGCSASPDGETAAQEEQGIHAPIHLCPEVIIDCPVGTERTCVTENGCPACTCAPVGPSTLYTGPGGSDSYLPQAIAIDTTNVYWTAFEGETWSVSTCAIGGCGGAPTVLASGGLANDEWSPYLAVDATNVYWVGGSSIYACAKTGCGNAPTVLASGQSPNGLAIDASNVYWANFGTGANAGAILACAKTGCGQKPVTIAANQSYVGPIAVDASGIYWFDERVAAGPSPAGDQLLMCPHGGCGDGPTVLGSGFAGQSITLDATSVYWVNASGWEQGSHGTVVRCPKTGCGASGPVVIASGQNVDDAVGITVDATNVYWTSLFSTPTPVGAPVVSDFAYTGAVMKCALTGCGTSATTLWSEPLGVESQGGGGPGPWGIAVDANNLYWANMFGAGGPTGESTGNPQWPGGSIMELPFASPASPISTF